MNAGLRSHVLRMLNPVGNVVPYEAFFVAFVAIVAVFRHGVSFLVGLNFKSWTKQKGHSMSGPW